MSSFSQLKWNVVIKFLPFEPTFAFIRTNHNMSPQKFERLVKNFVSLFFTSI